MGAPGLGRRHSMRGCRRNTCGESVATVLQNSSQAGSTWQHEGCCCSCERYKLYYDDGLSGPYTEAATE